MRRSTWMALLIVASIALGACSSSVTETGTTTPTTTPTPTTGIEQTERTEPLQTEPTEIPAPTPTTEPVTFLETSRVRATWNTPGVDEIQLLMSNQSFIDEWAVVTVNINGTDIMARLLETGDQHNFFAFNVNGIAPGEHTITFTSDDGRELVATFDKADEPLWIVSHFWPGQTRSGFDFAVYDEPVEFQ